MKTLRTDTGRFGLWSLNDIGSALVQPEERVMLSKPHCSKTKLSTSQTYRKNNVPTVWEILLHCAD